MFTMEMYDTTEVIFYLFISHMLILDHKFLDKAKVGFVNMFHIVSFNFLTDMFCFTCN